MLKQRNRRTESAVYAALWTIISAVYLLVMMRSRAQMSKPLLDLSAIMQFTGTILPFLILFAINNYLLIPKLLLRNRLALYLLCTAAAMIALWGYQYMSFMHHIATLPTHPRPPHPDMRPILPMPLLLDFTYAFLVVGCNLAIALLFQRFDDKLDRESLMKENAESQLTYLKQQINPHFYMNMLNNIHGMIEIDPEKAQRMVIDMSQLMRHMLYESSKPRIALGSEVEFLRNYLGIMCQRFPDDRVIINAVFPREEEMRHIQIPPLLFIVFIENAFKHGISYRMESCINVGITLSDTSLTFVCANSNHGHGKEDPAHTGIGLANIKKRLRLLYGKNATLSIDSNARTYRTTLTIPIHDTEDHYN